MVKSEADAPSSGEGVFFNCVWYAILFHMRLHRFYIEQKIPKEGEFTISDPELSHQLLNVFRFQAGGKVIVFDGSGFEYEAEIV